MKKLKTKTTTTRRDDVGVFCYWIDSFWSWQPRTRSNRLNPSHLKWRSKILLHNSDSHSGRYFLCTPSRVAVARSRRFHRLLLSSNLMLLVRSIQRMMNWNCVWNISSILCGMFGYGHDETLSCWVARMKKKQFHSIIEYNLSTSFLPFFLLNLQYRYFCS